MLLISTLYSSPTDCSPKDNRPAYFVGVDTHKFTHTACVVDSELEKLLTFTFKNEPMYFDEALTAIQAVTPNGMAQNIVFGLEDTQSFGFLFSNYLTGKGYSVKQVNPAFANAYRASLPNYHKSDAYDSFCVAKVLKDSYKDFPDFKQEILFSSIRLLTSQRGQLTKQQSINYIMLHQQLAKVYPGYTRFFCNAHTRSALAFFFHYPSPRFLKGLSAEDLLAAIKEHAKLFSLAKAELILETVRANKNPYEDPTVEDTIRDLIEDIYLKEKKLERLEERLQPLIDQTGYRLQTIPGVSIATASKLISEIGDISRFKNEKKLAQFCGIAPVSIGSAEKEKREHSKGGNRQLRATFYFLAVGMVVTNKDQQARHPYFRDYYLKKLQEGKTKPQAMICIMRQLVRIVYVMMKNKTEWKAPEYHQKYDVKEPDKKLK